MAIGFMVACRRFFGQRPGQTVKEFADEVRKLTVEDREELRPMLAMALGEDVEDK